MRQGKESRYGKFDYSRTLGGSILKIMELQINREYQIINPKIQPFAIIEIQNSKLVLVVVY